MNRTELLDFMKGKISNYYYEILVVWTQKREKNLFGFDTKFDVEPTAYTHNGYVVNGPWLSFIIVYPN
jgi:hypothetical protein